MNPDDKEDILIGLNIQHDNFMKVLTYAGFLLETIKDTKSSLRNETLKMATLVKKNN